MTCTLHVDETRCIINYGGIQDLNAYYACYLLTKQIQLTNVFRMRDE